jgi:hypothetical protein
MQSKSIALTLTILASILFPAVAHADREYERGYTVVYEGENYNVTIGKKGEYTGCDAKKRCVFIEKLSRRDDKSYTWQKNGFVYKMVQTSVYTKNDYQLQVTNPQGQVIMSKAMRLPPFRIVGS